MESQISNKGNRKACPMCPGEGGNLHLPADFDKNFAESRLMGGFGSGGWNARHASPVEYHRRMDAGLMCRERVFREGYLGRLQWKSEDGECNWIGTAFRDGFLILDFKFRRNGGEWDPVKQTVSIVRFPCPKGGETALFLCPRCGARRKYLYGASRLFLCRRCHKLPYASQRERDCDRAGRRARKLRRKLGVEIGMGNWVGPKPKGMHQATFDRVRNEIHACEEVLEQQLVRILGRMQARQTGVRQQMKRFW
jgi:hypothetical protein